MRAVDCEALAGSWDLAAVREGFDIVHRVALPGGFGNEVIEENRGLLGQFDVETGDEGEWTPQKEISFMFGTPPCSGWSVMNTSKKSNARGVNSGIHNCTWGLVHYAGKTTGSDGKMGPEIVSFESVQQAFTQGRELMTAYLNLLRERTGEDYKLTHVMMSGSSVGSAQYRPRYFWVGHRVPFGVDVESPRDANTYGDAIGDLINHPLQRAPQPYLSEPTEYVTHHNLRNPSGEFSDHFPASIGDGTNNLDLTLRILEAAHGTWLPNEYQKDVIERLWAEGVLPEKAWKWIDPETGKNKGWGGPRRIERDRSAFVIHGGGPGQFIHWDEERWLTMRELTRLMGYPDTWKFPQGAHAGHIGAWLGKNCPVQSAQWLSYWVSESLQGRPGRLQGKTVDSRGKTDVDEPENEGVVNVTHAFRDPRRIIAQGVN